MKIGFDAKRAFCNYRGLGNYSRLVIEGLIQWSKNEAECFLFTPQKSLENYRLWPGSGVHVMEPQGVHRWMKEFWRGYFQVNFWSPLALDLYHGLSHDLPHKLDRHKSNIKTLVTIHDLIFLRNPELYPAWDRWTYLRKVKHSCAVADSIIAISEQTKIDLMEFLKIPESRIQVLYQAVHPRFYKSERVQPLQEILPKENSAPYFLFVGALEERKNITRLVSAFCKAQIPSEFQLFLIGKGAQSHSIQSLIQSFKMENRIFIKTDVSSDQLPAYYQKAYALLYPSLFEGFGLPVAEALMSETLIMTSQGSCFAESGGPGALYVNPLETESIINSLEKLVGMSTAEKQERIQTGLLHGEKFHWKSTTEALMAHYKKIL